jgi:hypothetical protein
MNLILTVLAILFAIAAATTPLIPAFVLRIGLFPLYRIRLIRASLIIPAWILAISTIVSTPPSFIALPVVLLLSIPTILLEPQRVFVSLDDPEHIAASQASLEENALVIGYEKDGIAAAWVFEMLVPRHLINDQIGGEPLLVAY